MREALPGPAELTKELMAVHRKVRLVSERRSKIVRVGPVVGQPMLFQNAGSIILTITFRVGGLQPDDLPARTAFILALGSMYPKLPWIHRPVLCRAAPAGEEARPDHFVLGFRWEVKPHAPQIESKQHDRPSSPARPDDGPAPHRRGPARRGRRRVRKPEPELVGRGDPLRQPAP